ncbi:MAG: condensation domain-containing protein, partial [bacterium]
PGTLETELAYWRRRLAGISAPALPFAAPSVRRAEAASRGRSLPWNLGPELSAAVRGFARERRATVFCVLFSSFVILLSGLGAGTDITVATPVARRDRRELQGLIGLLLDTVALRLDLSGGPDFEEVVSRASGVLLEAWSHSAAPFGQVVEELRRSSGGKEPPFPVAMTLEAPEEPPAEVAGLNWRPEAFERRVSEFDLILSAIDAGDSIRGQWLARSRSFDAGGLESYRGAYESLLSTVLWDPSAPLAKLTQQLRSSVDREEGERLKRLREGRFSRARRKQVVG